ncbi:Protein of unknown function [Fulvimarina manganoxydans]|uniref:DUF1761 domain-containing protein n=1 Tax=Fulvimarina manganoxydans TaxID=937218 RepID=A0A1W2BRQ4_9HYPH|nr:DUF1761 domain-containing protein [Fulvimarina manganoxydans]MCK5931763.1 DUF1761 domain-containing protein [Fulvimarina manganoxydans]SMC75426.1 Protein of unknown function [Fulvimarina manganoxydans]
MGIGSVDLFAVALATVASMVVGTIWYVALGHFWRRAARLGSEMSEPHFGIFVMTLVCEFVMAIVFASILQHGEIVALLEALWVAVLLWTGFVATTLIVNTRFQGFGWDLPLIDGGHWLMVLLAQACVFSVFL